MPKSLKGILRADALDKAKEHIRIQGEVIYAANRLQDAFYSIFLTAMSLERPDEFGAQIRFHHHALALWHALQSDSSQRDMAMTAIATVPTKLKLSPALHRLRWAKRQTELLWMYRNILTHTQVLFTQNLDSKTLKLVPIFRSHSTRPTHARRLDALSKLAICRGLRND